MIDPRLKAALAADHDTPSPALDALLTESTGVQPAPAGRGGTAGGGSRALGAALQARMQTDVPGRDKAPAGPYESIGEWLSVPAKTPPVTDEPSTWFTVNHWHWLAAKEMVPQMPAELGPTFPYLSVSETQIIRDLTHWSALDLRGRITDEAAGMFAAVSGGADMTLYGTVLLYALRRRPIELPAELKEFGLDAAVRNVPRVTFSIGITGSEVVTALVNNNTVVFSRRHRRSEESTDAADTLRELLDPRGQWAPYPMTGPVTLPADTVEALATGEETAGVIDHEPGDDASADERTADTARRKQVGKAVTSILKRARIPTGAAADIAGIATATTDAMAQVTLRTREVDVPRGDPSALACAFLRGRGLVVSYPSGSGANRHITYVSGTPAGIKTGIAALRRVVTGG